MARLKHTNLTIIMTMLAVILVLLSLLLPWYTVRLMHTTSTTTWVFHLDYAKRTSTQYSTVFPGPVVYEIEDLSRIGFDEVEALITMTKWAIVLWAFFSLVYVLSLLSGAPAYRRGWVMIATAALPILMFAFTVQGAVLEKFEYVGTTYDAADWVLSSGWVLALGAWFLQTVGVILRQQQLLTSDSRRRLNVIQGQQEDTLNGD